MLISAALLGVFIAKNIEFAGRSLSCLRHHCVTIASPLRHLASPCVTLRHLASVLQYSFPVFITAPFDACERFYRVQNPKI
jgi:hypothetical protein